MPRRAGEAAEKQSGVLYKSVSDCDTNQPLEPGKCHNRCLAQHFGPQISPRLLKHISQSETADLGPFKTHIEDESKYCSAEPNLTMSQSVERRYKSNMIHMGTRPFIKTPCVKQSRSDGVPSS